MAELIYRSTSNGVIPPTTSVKNAPLTNNEMDGNFRSIQVDLLNKATNTDLAAQILLAKENAMAMAIALS